MANVHLDCLQHTHPRTSCRSSLLLWGLGGLPPVQGLGVLPRRWALGLLSLCHTWLCLNPSSLLDPLLPGLWIGWVLRVPPSQGPWGQEFLLQILLGVSCNQRALWRFYGQPGWLKRFPACGEGLFPSTQIRFWVGILLCSFPFVLQLAGPALGKAKPRMSSSSLLGESSLEPPVLLSDIKTEPPEELLATDCNQPQAEPVDLSLHKPKGSLQPPPIRSVPMPAAPPAPVVSMSPVGLGSSSAIPAVLSPGSILASTQGSGGQQILHVIHTIPSVNLPSKMGNLQTIPVVVQSLPVVYTTMPSDGVTAAITVPLIGGDGKNAGSGELCLPSPHFSRTGKGGHRPPSCCLQREPPCFSYSGATHPSWRAALSGPPKGGPGTFPPWSCGKEGQWL